ncbi:MAG: carbon-nitrogen hydrolase family protein [Anaerolineae bacterium]|nr:carbon-nitrogen hydrolase family protein [Anaerolineae bacterium]
MSNHSARLTIGLVQMRCEKAAISDNIEQMAQYISKAREQNVDILGFPEMNITGYADPTRYPHAIIRLDGPEIAQVLKITEGDREMTVLAGLIEEHPGQKPYITQIAMCDGELLGQYRKVSIEDDEAAWFSAGETVPVFTHNDLTFGISICADIGNEAVFAACARQGARIVFELAAPGLYGDQASRNWQSGFEWWEGECQRYLSANTKTYGCWAAVATQAGRTIDEDFPGGGYVFAPDGHRLYGTSDWRPGAAYVSIDL